MRQLGSVATLLAQRSGAAASLQTALGQLRADAASASAVWIPASNCGPTVAMMRRNAAGTSFTAYLFRNGSLQRASAAGPIDPCDATLHFDTVLAGVTSMTAAAFTAASLASHVDPVNGNADGALFQASVPVVAVSSHALDYDGSTILTGNGVVEVSLDADPAEATIDLIAGNKPNAYTDVLTYSCGARCAANVTFPEIASLDYNACVQALPDVPDTSASYVAASTGVGAAGRIVTTAYAVRLRYGFTFSGAAPALTVEREGPTFTWPAAANLSDPYPVDYTNNAVHAAGAAALAALFGSPANLQSEIGICSGFSTESLFHG